MTDALREACRRAVHVLTPDGTLMRGGRASAYVLWKLGHRSARLLMFPPLSWPTELGYFIVATNRPFFAKFLFRNPPPLPPGEGRE